VRKALTKAVGATAVTALVCAYIARHVVSDYRGTHMNPAPVARPIDF